MNHLVHKMENCSSLTCSKETDSSGKRQQILTLRQRIHLTFIFLIRIPTSKFLSKCFFFFFNFVDRQTLDTGAAPVQLPDYRCTFIHRITPNMERSISHLADTLPWMYSNTTGAAVEAPSQIKLPPGTELVPSRKRRHKPRFGLNIPCRKGTTTGKSHRKAFTLTGMNESGGRV